MSAEATRIALVQICVDDRLDHTKIRAQVSEKIRSVYLKADRVFLLNEVGGNLGHNLRNTMDVFLGSGAEVSFCAVLHHDDCAAAQAGFRLPMERTIGDLALLLSERSVNCPIYSGVIRTSDSLVSWGTGESYLPRAA